MTRGTGPTALCPPSISFPVVLRRTQRFRLLPVQTCCPSRVGGRSWDLKYSRILRPASPGSTNFFPIDFLLFNCVASWSTALHSIEHVPSRLQGLFLKFSGPLPRS